MHPSHGGTIQPSYEEGTEPVGHGEDLEVVKKPPGQRSKGPEHQIDGKLPIVKKSDYFTAFETSPKKRTKPSVKGLAPWINISKAKSLYNEWDMDSL
jgi:hypothetical protein